MKNKSKQLECLFLGHNYITEQYMYMCNSDHNNKTALTCKICGHKRLINIYHSCHRMSHYKIEIRINSQIYRIQE